MRIDFRFRSLALLTALVLLGGLVPPAHSASAVPLDSSSEESLAADGNALWEKVTSWVKSFFISEIERHEPLDRVALTASGGGQGTPATSASTPPETDDGPDMDPDG